MYCVNPNTNPNPNHWHMLVSTRVRTHTSIKLSTRINWLSAIIYQSCNFCDPLFYVLWSLIKHTACKSLALQKLLCFYRFQLFFCDNVLLSQLSNANNLQVAKPLPMLLTPTVNRKGEIWTCFCWGHHIIHFVMNLLCNEVETCP